MNRIIIVEGPQGVGKSTLTNYLRDVIPSSNLLRLSGVKDKTNKGKDYEFKIHNEMINYLNRVSDVPADFILDRSFMSEEVYTKLGFKDYSFDDEYNKLVKKLYKLNYEIIFLVLYLKNTNVYKDRLGGRVHHNYQSFSLNNSINQQNMYLTLANNLNKNIIKCVLVDMSDFDNAYKYIDKLLNIEKR